jgi:hypothetical protein
MISLRIVFVAAALCLSLTSGVLAQQSSVTAGTSTDTAGKLDIDVVTGNTGTSAFRVFNSGSVGLLSVAGTGDVIFGGGTSALYHPSDRFYFFENADTNTSVTVDNPHGGAAAAGIFRAQSDVATVSFQAHGSGRTVQRFDLPSLGGWAEFLHWRGNGFVIGNTHAVPLILGTSNKDRLHIDADGRVGINIPNPSTRFEVVGTATQGGASRRVVRVWDDTASAAGVGAGIDLIGKYSATGSSTEFANIKGVKANATDGDTTGNLVLSVSNPAAGTTSEIVRLAPGGMTVTGDATFSGTVSGGYIKAHYQDLAEWVPSRHDLAPGTVVILDSADGLGILASTTPYDTKVAGVVSAQPGIILGEAGAAKEQVATTGRVRVKVDATLSAIAVGDLLVTSDKPGFAMKSIPVEVSGVSIHRPGTIVGKALEPLARGEGEILVLLSLQ